MNEHKHTIIIIKNNEDKYLQYYDNRWNSFLFLNCKVDDNFQSQVIIDYLKNSLKISENNFECNYVMDKVHKKYSESAKKEKQYHHYFYNVNIKNMPNIMKEEHFTIDNIEYSWYSLEELESNKRIQEVNSDIVNFIKEI